MERILKRIARLGVGRHTDDEHRCDDEATAARDDSGSPADDGGAVLNTVVATSADCVGAGVASDQLCVEKGRYEAPAGKRRQRRLVDRIYRLHYLDLHRMEFRPGALRRRFCGGKKRDNELYRSNSFKFERFDRSDDTGLLQNQVVVCEEYSFPVDFVRPPRPHSFATGLADWSTPSPTGQQVAVVTAYCDPLDAKWYLEPGAEVSKLYTSPDRDYSQPYTDDSSVSKGPLSDEEDDVYEDVSVSLSVDQCVTVIRVNDDTDDEELKELSSRPRAEGSVRRNPSPYYYGDLFRAEIGRDGDSVSSYQLRDESAEHISSLGRFLGGGGPRLHGCRKSASLDTPTSASGIVSTATSAGQSLETQGNDRIGYKKSISLDTAEPGDKYFNKLFKKTTITNESSFLEHYNYSAHDAYSSKERSDSLLEDCLLEWDSLMPPRREVRGVGLPSSCACAGGGKCVAGNREDIDDVLEDRLSQKQRHGARNDGILQQNDRRSLDEPEVEYDSPEVEYFIPEDMSGRQRHLYETAFDCKVTRSDDDLDDVDRVTNHPILHKRVGLVSNVRLPRPGSSQELGSGVKKERRVVSLVRGKLVKERPKSLASHVVMDSSSSSATLSRDLNDLNLDGGSSDSKLGVVTIPALRGSFPSPSPPSTAPLPTKFHGKDELNLMNSIKSSPTLPTSSPGHPRLKDLRLPVKSLRAREEKGIVEFKGRPRSFAPKEVSEEPNIRPRSMFHEGDLLFKDGSAEVDDGASGRALRGKLRSDKSSIASDFSRSKIKGNETDNILEIKGRPHRKTGVRLNFSSTESMVTSSSGGSLESIRSSTSEGNRSTSSSESQHSASLSSHSSDSIGSCSTATMNLHRFYHHHHHQSPGGPMGGSRFFAHQGTKLHILSPISDKSSLEPASETSDNNRNNNSQKASPEENQITQISPTKPVDQPWMETGLKVKRRTPQNKNLIHLSVLQSSSSGEAEVQGSDSGISIESRGTSKNHKGGFAFLKIGSKVTDNNACNTQHEQHSDFSDLPFDMPKLRRRRLLQQDTCTSGSTTSIDLHELPFDMPKLRRRLQQDTCTSGSATSVDLQDLPFDMPKLKRRLRQPQTSFDASQMSSSHFVTDADRKQATEDSIRPSLTLNLLSNKTPPQQLFGLSLNFGGASAAGDDVDSLLPLERQGWYHGTISRLEAESILRLLKEGSYLVRNSESTRQDYSLSLKSARGFMHMRIQASPETGKYVLGQFSKPFENIPEMIRHYSINRLPIRGAEHMCLLHPVIDQLL